MFEIKIDNARYWKNCVDSIVSLVEEGTFNIAKEGITLKALDPSVISMVMFSIPNKAFSKYDVEKPTAVGLDLTNFAKMLSSARPEEQLIMKDSGNKLQIEFIGPLGKRRFKLPMLDIKKDAEKEPKVAFESFVDIRSDTLREILKDTNFLSENVGFRTDKGSLMIVAKGDGGELEEEFPGNTESIRRLEVNKASSATFKLDYLQRIISACPIESPITLSLKSEEPMRIDYKIGDATVAYYLAPYIES
jgi:proliferating cell nuclear antigen